jgi:acetyl-CoA C-acetyltransferase
MSNVYIASVGLLPIEDHWDKSITDLMVEAALKALEKVPWARPERVIVGNMFSGVSSSQEHLGALLASCLGLKGIPAFKVEAACGSGGVAVHEGYVAVKAGLADVVLVVGVEKMKDMLTPKTTKALAMAEHADFTQAVGATFISLNALVMRLYMERYGVSREEMAAFPILAHKNAVTAPHAQFKRAITLQDVINSPMVSAPLRLLDSAPAGDGAVALILVSDKYRSKENLVEIVGSEVANNYFLLGERERPLFLEATAVASKRAFERAGLTIKDMDFLEVHDAFSVTAALSLETLGISDEGKAPRDALNGRFNLDGEMPILTFGGLKARGHPVGATGAYQVAEAYLQLTDQAGPNQVKGARYGFTHNFGALDTTTAVHILKRVM